MGLTIGAVASAGAASRATADAAVHLTFAAVVGSTPADCSRSYPGIGTTKSAITVTDLRFYVSNIRVVDAGGTEVPVALTQDGLWQNGSVALLDFEDGSGHCVNGTAETHRAVDGTVAAGTYRALRFDVGLPFDVNHRDPTSQPSPLNLSQLFWNWNGGYKFVRIEIGSTGVPQGWVVHLGSTGCVPRPSPNAVPTSCSHENRPTVSVPIADVTHLPAIELDLAALFADSNVDTGEGCMSGPDPACEPVFHAFGLPAGNESSAPAQRVFRAAK
jgi:uncharacterized repeat protein (TIGR04052 family)